MTEQTKMTIISLLIVCLIVCVAGLGYLGHIYYSETPVQASSEAVEPQATQVWRITAYCPCEKCCGKWSDGQTASGYWIQPGDRFVAAPKHIPFGTKFIVPGYNNDKPVEVKDRGGAITVERLDVYFDTHQEALNWGVQYLEIKQ